MSKKKIIFLILYGIERVSNLIYWLDLRSDGLFGIVFAFCKNAFVEETTFIFVWKIIFRSTFYLRNALNEVILNQFLLKDLLIRKSTLINLVKGIQKLLLNFKISFWLFKIHVKCQMDPQLIQIWKTLKGNHFLR